MSLEIRTSLGVSAPLRWSADPLAQPEDTRRALETDGRTALLSVLDQGRPPPVVRCDPTGCTYPVRPCTRADVGT
jgi:hypothetical protein